MNEAKQTWLANDCLDIVLESSSTEPAAAGNESRDRADGVVIGRLAGWDASGYPLVEFPRNPASAPVVARSIVPLQREQTDCEVALLFVGGDRGRPLLVGLLQPPLPSTAKLEPNQSTTGGSDLQCHVDDQRLVLQADREIVLRCGKSSITLTRAGKVLIRGEYVLSRSSGVNRIKGGSVQIN